MKNNTGRDFESAVYRAVKKAVQSGSLGLDPRRTKVYRSKGYHSRDRGKEIVTDVSIEIFIAGATAPAIVWVWECKDYSRAIPVDAVEEFHAKLEQIGADSTKGTLIARGYFQEATIEYAASKGVGIATLRARHKIDHYYCADPIEFPWEKHSPGKLLNRQYIALTVLTDPNYCEPVLAFHGEDPDRKIGFYALCSDGNFMPSSTLYEYVHRELECWGCLEDRE